jgi:hypothetical protein
VSERGAVLSVCATLVSRTAARLAEVRAHPLPMALDDRELVIRDHLHALVAAAGEQHARGWTRLTRAERLDREGLRNHFTHQLIMTHGLDWVREHRTMLDEQWRQMIEIGLV